MKKEAILFSPENPGGNVCNKIQIPSRQKETFIHGENWKLFNFGKLIRGKWKNFQMSLIFVGRIRRERVLILVSIEKHWQRRKRQKFFFFTGKTFFRINENCQLKVFLLMAELKRVSSFLWYVFAFVSTVLCCFFLW